MHAFAIALLRDVYRMLWGESVEDSFQAQGQATCVTISKLGQKVTLQGIEPGSLL
jgi:hypothetical protein